MCDTGLNIVAAMAVNILLVVTRLHFSAFVNYACVTVTVGEDAGASLSKATCSVHTKTPV